MRKRLLVLSSLIFCGVGLTGCSSDGSHWWVNYRDMDVEHAHSVDPERVQFEVAYSIEELRHTPQAPGYRLMGSSYFIATHKLEGPNGEPGTDVREFASRIGATFVRWCDRPVTPRQEGFTEHFHYLALFYRETGPQTREQVFVNATESPRDFNRTIHASYEYRGDDAEPERSAPSPMEIANVEVPADADE